MVYHTRQLASFILFNDQLPFFSMPSPEAEENPKMAFCLVSLQIPLSRTVSRRKPSSSTHTALSQTRFSNAFTTHSPSSRRFSSSSRTLKCSSQRQSPEEFERLFSNLNQVTLKKEPGGAGILAIPAVTQEAGFLASAIACILCWIYMAVTGLLIAEINVNTVCEPGSGGVSPVSMAMRTLGKVGVQIACA